MIGKIIELNVIATNQNRLKILKMEPLYKTRENVLKKTILQQAKKLVISHINAIGNAIVKYLKILSCFLNLI